MRNHTGKDFSGQKFIKGDFSDQNHQYTNFRSASLIEANFRNTDLSYANFTGANCYGADFTGAILYRTNMMDCILERSIMKPKNIFGLTLTMKCETFRGMVIDEDWLECWSFFPVLMDLPEAKKNPKPWLDRIIQLLGPERYPRLKAVFERRVI